MVDLGAADLSFTVRETAELLRAHGVTLGDPALVELRGLTGGWPAGLRLGALALRDQTEPDDIVTEVISADPGVTEYIDKEILAALPPHRRRLLRDLSVVEMVSDGLVEALTGCDDGRAVVAEFERAKVFAARRGRAVRWHQHHPMLATHLYEELRRESPQRIQELHRAAAAWHADNGLPAVAIRHALAAEDWALAVSLVRAYWPDVVLGGHSGGGARAAPGAPGPPDLRPELVMAFAAERLDAGDLAGVRSFRQAAELPTADQAAVPGPGGVGLPGSMSTILRIAEARLSGDHEFVRKAASALLAEPDSDDGGPVPDPVRVVGLVALGTARLRLGEQRAAESLLLEGLALAIEADLRLAQVAALCQLSALAAARGHLRDAMETGHRAVTLAHRIGITDSVDLARANLAMGETYLQWNRLEDGLTAVDAALDQARIDPALLAECRLLQARLLATSGAAAAAFEAVALARLDLVGRPVATPLRVASLLVEAELRLRGGDPGAARELLAQIGPDDPFPDWSAVVRTEALLAEGKPAAAAATVAPFIDGRLAGSSQTTALRAAILGTQAAFALGDRDRAFHGLRGALRIAEAHGHRVPFMTARTQLRELLDNYAPALDVDGGFVADLSATLDRVSDAEATNGAEVMVQPLTDRERTVLRYLRGTMSNVEIADMLYVSVNTVKTHVRSIYRKLGASRRREAVRRARDLHLI